MIISIRNKCKHWKNRRIGRLRRLISKISLNVDYCIEQYSYVENYRCHRCLQILQEICIANVGSTPSLRGVNKAALYLRKEFVDDCIPRIKQKYYRKPYIPISRKKLHQWLPGEGGCTKLASFTRDVSSAASRALGLTKVRQQRRCSLRIVTLAGTT